MLSLRDIFKRGLEPTRGFTIVNFHFVWFTLVNSIFEIAYQMGFNNVYVFIFLMEGCIVSKKIRITIIKAKREIVYKN